MTAQLAPTPVFRATDGLGFPLFLGRLTTYQAGTLIPQATYIDSTQTTPNTNPIILNARGEAQIWLDPTKAYKFTLTDAFGNNIPGWPVDNITIGNANPSFNVIPTVDNLFTLGSPTFAWANVYVGANHAPVLDTVSGNIGYYARTAAEIAAGVTPTNYVYAPGNVLRYGADSSGAVDSSAAFNKAALAGAGLILVPGGNYKIASQVTINIAACGILGQGATITSALAAGTLFEITSSAGGEANTKNAIEGLTIVGTNIAGVYAMDFFVAAAALVAGINVRDCTFTAFDKCVQIRSNAFMINFFGCTFSQGGASGCVHIPAGGANYAERVTFVGCNFFNNTICLKSDYSSSSVHLLGCSLDYSSQVLVNNGGWFQCTGCYFESNIDTGYWFTTAADQTTIFDGCSISQTGPKPNFNWAQSSSSLGAINFRNCILYSNSNTIVSAVPFLCALGGGNGSAYGSGNRMVGFNPAGSGWAAVSASSGLQPSLNAGLPGFTIGSTGTGGSPFEGGGVGPGGTNALGFQVAVNGQDQFAYVTIAAQAGDNVGIACQIKTNNVAAPFQLQIQALDAAGILLGSSTLTGGLNSWDGSISQLPLAYTWFRTLFPSLPAGTVTTRVRWITTGATNTTYQILVGTITIGKY